MAAYRIRPFFVDEYADDKWSEMVEYVRFRLNLKSNGNASDWIGLVFPSSDARRRAHLSLQSRSYETVWPRKNVMLRTKKDWYFNCILWVRKVPKHKKREQ